MQDILARNYAYTVNYALNHPDPTVSRNLRRLFFRLLGLYHGTLTNPPAVDFSGDRLPELADFCTRVGILEEGKLVAFGTLDEVLHRAACEGYQLRVLGSAQRASELLLAAGAEQLESLDDGIFTFRLAGGPQAAAALLKTLALEDLEPCELVAIRSDLESAYLSLTRGGESE